MSIRDVIKSLAVAAVLTAMLLVGSAVPAGAATQHIPNGLSDFMGGVLPPPGFYWLNYVGLVTKDTLRDKDGDKVPVSFDAKVYFDAFRLVYMTPYKLGDATWGVQAIVPIYNADVSVKSGSTSLVSSTASGLGDITIDPIVLAWHFSPNFHMGAGLDIVLPTGNYDKDRPATQILAKNHYTFEPLVALSYWVPGGVDLSAKIMYDFHTSNTDLAGTAKKLKPGQEFHFDWAASYAVTSEDLRLGLTGYYYTMVTKDDVDGTKDDLSAIAAVGAALKYWPKMGPFSITAKYMQEFEAKNLPEGNNFWINFIWAL